MPPQPQPEKSRHVGKDKAWHVLSLSALRAALGGPGHPATEVRGVSITGAPWPSPHLQCVQVRQPDAVPPAQVPPKVVVADVDGFQVPGFIPEEVQHIDGLQHRSGQVLTTGADGKTTLQDGTGSLGVPELPWGGSCCTSCRAWAIRG